MSAASAPPLIAASFDVYLGGNIDPRVARTLTTIKVEAKVDRPAQCRLTLLDTLDGGAPSVPADTPVVVKTRGGEDLFDGLVTGIERSWQHDGVRVRTVRATDRLCLLRSERRAGVEEGDLLEITERVAARHGLAVQTRLSRSTAPVTGQFGETDLAFLRRIFARAGLHLTVRGQTMHVFDLDGVGDVLDLRTGHELHSLSIDERYDVDTEPVSVAGWHLEDADAHETGAHSLRTGWILNAEAGRALARAIDERRDQQRLVIDGVSAGDTRIAPGCRVRAGEDGDLYEPVLITSVEHHVDATEGFTTRFTSQPLDPEPTSPAATWTLGMVVDVDDPHGSGRVMVDLPAHGGQTTHWLPVVLPGLGEDKGFVCLPDVGDRVVVLGNRDDPGTGVVLGGILGRTPATEGPIVDGRTRRTITRLPGGGRVIIDDDAESVTVDNGAGTYLELGPEKALLQSATDLEIAAPGQRLLIRANAIDMEQA